MKNNYSVAIANEIKAYLTEEDWSYSFNEEKGIFQFDLQLHGKMKKIDYVIDVKEDAYIVYAFSPVNADKDDAKTMSEMTEFLCRANYGLKRGNFEMDMEDGEVRYKMVVDCGDDSDCIPTKSIIKRSIYTPASMMQKYGDELLAVMYGFMEPKEAVEKAEA